MQDGISKVLEGLTTLEELLKIIELDDDSTVHATGLENAIEDNELVKENTKNEQPVVIEVKSFEVTESDNANKLVEETNSLFDEPQTLVNNTESTLNEIDSNNIDKDEYPTTDIQEEKKPEETKVQNNSFTSKKSLFSDKKKFF